uniref:Armadillo repeat containing 5 n=1 Tax=Takifugu rubripes TaxID=31033 RepID=H2T3J1_TAKRU
MAASPVQGGREGHSPAPENSLTWCLAHLSKPRQVAESHGQGKAEQGGGREMDKKSRISQWRALVAIRTHHIKGDKAGIARFRTQGGLRPLLDLLKHPDCSRKVLDLALSILGNCCTELETRTEILKRNVALETVLNRTARALGNLAMDADGSALIHSAGGVSLLLICLSLSSGPSSPTGAPKDTSSKLECAQSAARALLYLADTPSNRLSLLTQGTLYALAPLIAPEYPQPLRKAALRTLHELTRGCTVECAREVSRSGVLNQLGVMASGESGRLFEELAMKTLANMCFQGSLRPLVGSLGVIPKFTEEVKRDPLKSGVFLKALCLCCKEAVNRAKVKESGGLEVLIGFLAAHQSHPFSRLAIFACVDFVFDEAAMEQLQELGLVPLLVARLVELTRGEEQSPEKMDVHTSSCMSWLLSEGLISSEGDLLDSSGRGHSATSLTKVTLDAPPSVPRSTGYHHPYHPEPWTPESPILLLLSRFSHATDPSAALVSAGITAGLLCYLTQHRDPSSRCLRMLCRLSCNPNCLEALVRTGSVALIHHHLCQREGGPDHFFPSPKAELLITVCSPVVSAGFSLLNNLRVQCESGYGSGVLAHVMLSGSNSDKMNCALSLPFVSSGGLLLALQPGIKTEFGAKDADGAMTPPVAQADRFSPPPFKKPRLADECPYSASDFDLLLKLDDGTLVPANREAVAGAEASERAGSEYFRGLLRGGFGEALAKTEEAIPIKGVSTGMLLPVLHYLHGCGFTRGRGDGEKGGHPVFQTTPLGEMMVGACRFLVAELQRELEDLCVSLLLSPVLSVKRCSVQRSHLYPSHRRRWTLMDPLSDGSSRSPREERWCERCGTESGFRRPREISASKESS